MFTYHVNRVMRVVNKQRQSIRYVHIAGELKDLTLCGRPMQDLARIKSRDIRGVKWCSQCVHLRKELMVMHTLSSSGHGQERP